MVSRIRSFFKRRPIISLISSAFLLYFLVLFWLVAPFLSYALHPFALAGGEKNYLILFQNNYELRPTGGFISAFAIATVENGIPRSLNFEDVYGTVDDHSRIEPPQPLGALLAHPNYTGHSFRDANVFPHFPASVRSLEEFLHKTRPFQKIDGVIAVDINFLEYLLDAVGGVTIGDEKFTAVHLLEQIENQVANVDVHSLEDLSERKSSMRVLVKKLGKKALLPWNVPSVISALKKSLKEKHSIVYFKDESLQRLTQKRNWGGILEGSAGEDLLAVVDANYGGGKSNRYLQKSIFYLIDLEKGKGQLDVRFDHAGDSNLPLSTDYKGYIRAYAPRDHAFIGAALTGNEQDLSFGGETVSVPIRGQKTVHFDVDFPPSTLDALTYRLHLWKQPGTRDDYYSIAVRVPTGMRVRSKNFRQKENIASWHGLLTEDQFLSFTLERDPYPPRVIDQYLSALNRVDLWFNEPINPSSVKTEELKLVDTNTKNPVLDSIKIVSSIPEGTHLTVLTEGMTAQSEERYILELSGVSDYSNNALEKRTYTFYQRLK